jgi:16S rRNA (uracil1498-N3)-methyltransferase
MARRRFFVEEIRDGVAELTGDDAMHLSRVLRVAPGQKYEISDNHIAYLAEIQLASKARVGFRVLERLPDAPDSGTRIRLLASLIKFDRFEWMVEKATELGVETIVPVRAARSEEGLMRAAAKRVERWRRIARESSQQSRRTTMPVIEAPVEFAAALTGPPGLLLDEQPGPPPLATAVISYGPEVSILAGPEGGWTDSERRSAVDLGWSPVSLGPRILRAETAAIAAVAIAKSAGDGRTLK